MATLSTEERAALKQRAAEVKNDRRRGTGEGKAAADAQDVLDKIAEMPAPDRALAERVHVVVTAAVPEVAPKLWYGMPAYARGGKVVCFFRSGQMDGTRYSVFGFNDTATLDDGGMWPTSWALTALDEAAEAEITALVKRAVG
ncbi:iron chaperone [Blastococcus sp. SYSU DS1024]